MSTLDMILYDMSTSNLVLFYCSFPGIGFRMRQRINNPIWNSLVQLTEDPTLVVSYTYTYMEI